MVGLRTKEQAMSYSPARRDKIFNTLAEVLIDSGITVDEQAQFIKETEINQSEFVCVTDDSGGLTMFTEGHDGRTTRWRGNSSWRRETENEAMTLAEELAAEVAAEFGPTIWVAFESREPLSSAKH
jgi:hypothetical protein